MSPVYLHERRRRVVALLIAIAAVAFAVPCAQAQKKGSKKNSKPTIEQLRKESKQVTKQMKVTDRKLTENADATRRNLNRLDKLRTDMAANRRILSTTKALADSLDADITRINDTIATMQSHLQTLQDAYARSLRSLQEGGGGETNSLMAYVLSSENVAQAWRRVRYLRQFSKWRQNKAEQVRIAADELALRRRELENKRSQKDAALKRLDLAERQLSSQEKQTEQLVATLKKEAGSLQAELARQQKRQKELDSTIDRLIAQEAEKRRKAAAEAKKKREAEQAKAKAKSEATKSASSASSSGTAANKATAPSKPKPEVKIASDLDAALSGSFASNKGRLLFPVSGRYSIARNFGVNQHPELKHVTTNNSGIDIEAARGASARAVFDGQVSAIFKQDGYNSIVMVRHGDYLTIYAGLSGLNVRNGQKVKTGDPIGTIYTDPDNDSRTILHFELRHERSKLNPSEWLRR